MTKKIIFLYLLLAIPKISIANPEIFYCSLLADKKIAHYFPCDIETDRLDKTWVRANVISTDPKETWEVYKHGEFIGKVSPHKTYDLKKIGHEKSGKVLVENGEVIPFAIELWQGIEKNESIGVFFEKDGNSQSIAVISPVDKTILTNFGIRLSLSKHLTNIKGGHLVFKILRKDGQTTIYSTKEIVISEMEEQDKGLLPIIRANKPLIDFRMRNSKYKKVNFLYGGVTKIKYIFNNEMGTKGYIKNISIKLPNGGLNIDLKNPDLISKKPFLYFGVRELIENKKDIRTTVNLN